MNSTAIKFVKGIYSEYVGKKTQVLAEIEVYLNSPVGIGEHSKISVEIKNRFEELAQLEGVLQTIEKHFDISEMTESPQLVENVNQTAE